jgi:DNA-binding response OmpR family regulator
MTILLIDDDPYWSKGFREHAALFEGWEVLYASSPKEGMNMLTENKSTIDIILVDVMMTADDSVPEARDQGGLSTGLLLLKHLLPVTEGKIPIVLLSARQDVEEREYKGEARLLVQKNLPTRRVIEEIQEAIKS